MSTSTVTAPDLPGNYGVNINQLLMDKLDGDFVIHTYFGNELTTLPESLLCQIADCYKDIFNESWGESWTTNSALKQVRESLKWRPHRVPIGAFLYKGDDLIGFCWGLLVHKSNLSAEHDMPFELSAEEKQKGIILTRYWMDNVAKKNRVFLWCELGVLKTYRRNVTALLCLPLFRYAKEKGHDVTLTWTSLSSQGFKWGLGLNLSPVHFFQADDLLIMAGSVKQVINVCSDMAGLNEGPKSSRALIANINRYLCK